MSSDLETDVLRFAEEKQITKKNHDSGHNNGGTICVIKT